MGHRGLLPREVRPGDRPRTRSYPKGGRGQGCGGNQATARLWRPGAWRVQLSDAPTAPPRPSARHPDRHHRRPGRGLPPPAHRKLRHGGHRVHARTHLLARALPGAARRREGGRADRHPGRGHRPRTAGRAAGRSGGDESVPRRAAGRGDFRAALRRRADTDVRHTDRRHGRGVRRPGRLRRAGLGTDRWRDRQGAPVQRLVGAAAVGLATGLCGGGRDPLAGGLPPPESTSGTGGAAGMGRPGNGGADQSRYLPHRSRNGVGAAETAPSWAS